MEKKKGQREIRSKYLLGMENRNPGCERLQPHVWVCNRVQEDDLG